MYRVNSESQLLILDEPTNDGYRNIKCSESFLLDYPGCLP
jgi:ATPase subunit of ABC transporter with duplicated ATPase domains